MCFNPLSSSEFSSFSSYLPWLQQHIPDWASFKILTHSEYLGFEVGPTAESAQFGKVLASFKHHLSIIISSGAPPSISVFIYNFWLFLNFLIKLSWLPFLNFCLVMNPSGIAIFLKPPLIVSPPPYYFMVNLMDSINFLLWKLILLPLPLELLCPLLIIAILVWFSSDSFSCRFRGFWL